MKEEIFCGYCNTKIHNMKTPCPNCGSTKRHYHVQVTTKIVVLDELKLKQKRKGVQGNIIKETYRNKISGGTKAPAKEYIIIDRSDNTKTVKKHHVKELIDGQWVTVHDELKEYKAKRRK